MEVRVLQRAGRHAVSVAVTLLVIVGSGSGSSFTGNNDPASAGVQRLPPPFSVTSDPTVEAAVLNAHWTQYADYGTVQIGGVERPARLFTGRRHWVRHLTVPPGGAHWEGTIGAVDRVAIVRAGVPGATPSETRAPAGAWTRVALDLDSTAGVAQSIDVDVEAGPGGVAAWGSELVTPRHAQQRQPDVLLISLDTVRRDQLTPYVPTLSTTPVLGAFARNAMKFDQAISTSSWTIAAHEALFTGHFPADSVGYGSRVGADEFTLPEIFAAKGYRTFGVSGGPYTDPRWGLHQGFDEYVVSGERENAHTATSRAIEWMKKTRGEPVFVFLNYFNAHEPLELSPEVRLETGVMEDVPGDMWHAIDDRRSPVTADVRRRLTTAYRAELSTIDKELGRLFNDLERQGRLKSTLVIVLADHGQLLGERGEVGHAYTLEEELLRVPLIIKPPAGSGLQPGVYRYPIQHDDVFSLCQTLGGLPNKDGEEIASAVRAGIPFRTLTFSKIHHDPLPALVAHPRWRSATQWAVRDGRTKIVRDLEGRSFAFDISGSEERPVPITARESDLLTALRRFQSWSDGEEAVPAIPLLSVGEADRLRALGYVR